MSIDIFTEETRIQKPQFNWNFVVYAVLILFIIFAFFRSAGKQGNQGQVDISAAAVIVAYEKDDLPNQTQVSEFQSEADYWEDLKSKGVYWRFYDIEADEIKEYRTDAEKVGLPAILIIGPNSNGEGVVKSSASFETVQEAKNLIEKSLK